MIVFFCLVLGLNALLYPAGTENMTPSVFMRLPKTRQSTNYSCGPAALQSVLHYYGAEFREDVLIKNLKATPENGTNYREIANFAKSQGFDVQICQGMTLDQLKLFLHQKQPVIIALQAWAENEVNYMEDWEDGHYVVAIGYDDQRIYFMDPSTLGNYTYIPTSAFLQRWHDTDADNTRLVQFGMVITKQEPVYDPDTFIYMK